MSARKIVLLCALGAVAVAAGGVAMAAKTKGMYVPADKLEFKEIVPGVSQAVLWGDPRKGPYGALTKFAPNTKHPLHSHANTIKMVVITGNLIMDTGTGEVTYGPGSYLLAPGGSQHTSGTDGNGCLIFEEGAGKFTMTMVQEKK